MQVTADQARQKRHAADIDYPVRRRRRMRPDRRDPACVNRYIALPRQHGTAVKDLRIGQAQHGLLASYLLT
jgi:hypothetical protein